MSGHITKLSDTLERKTVTYPNRYGFNRLCIGAVAYRPEDEAALEQYWGEE